MLYNNYKMTYETRNENQSNQNGNRYQKHICFCGGSYSERNRHRHEKSKTHKKAEQDRNDLIIIDLMKDDNFNYDRLSNKLKKMYLDYINRNEDKEEYEPIKKTMIIDLDDDDTGGIVIEANNFKDFKNKLKELADIKERAEKTELDYMKLLRMTPPTIKDIYKITKAETRALTNYGHKIRRQHGEDKAKQMKENFINVLKLGNDRGFKFYFDYNFIDEEDRKDYNRLNKLKKYHMIDKKLSLYNKSFMNKIYSYGCGICGDNEASNTINTIKFNHILLCDECHYNNVLRCDNCQLCVLEHQNITENIYKNYGLLIDEFFNVICDNHSYYPIKCNCKDNDDIRARCNILDNKYFNLCPLAYDTLIWMYENDDNRGADVDPKEFINRIEESINKRIPQTQKEFFYKCLRDNEISQALTYKNYMDDGYNEETIKESYIYDKKPFKKNYKKKYVSCGCDCDGDNNYRCMTFRNHNNFIKCPYKFHTIAYDMTNQEPYIKNDIINNIIDNDIFKYYNYVLDFMNFGDYINYGTNETLKELCKRYLKHNNLRYTNNNMRCLLTELYNVYRDEADQVYNIDINDILF